MLNRQEKKMPISTQVKAVGSLRGRGKAWRFKNVDLSTLLLYELLESLILGYNTQWEKEECDNFPLQFLPVIVFQPFLNAFLRNDNYFVLGWE